MRPAFIASIERASLIAAACVLAAGVGLAAWIPISVPEAYAFSHFVRPPLRDWLGRFDPALHVLSILLVKRSVALLRLSAFSMRAPELLGLAVYLWAVAKLARRFWIAVPLAGALYLAWELQFPAGAIGMGLALWVCGLERGVAYLQSDQPHRLRNLNLAGLFLGLSVAANFSFLIQSVVLAVILGLAGRRRSGLSGRVWAERLALTAVVTAFLLLVLPFSRATAVQLAQLTMPPRVRLDRSPQELAALARVLERETHGRVVRIAAPLDVAPVLEFYQARDRQAGWRIVLSPAQADYLVGDRYGLPPAAQLLYRGPTLALAH